MASNIVGVANQLRVYAEGNFALIHAEVVACYR